MWISVKDEPPKETGDWLFIKIDNKEQSYPVKAWEDSKGGIVFVNSAFERELNVTHWRIQLHEENNPRE